MMADPYYLWFLVCTAFVGTFVWRFLGVVIGDRIPQESWWSQWINGVAYAMVAGVMMLIVVFPSGLVATTELSWRLAALVTALGVMLWRRNMIIAVASGLIAFVLASFFGI
jgi:branched-subunit amino acid transport protein